MSDATWTIVGTCLAIGSFFIVLGLAAFRTYERYERPWAHYTENTI